MIPRRGWRVSREKGFLGRDMAYPYFTIIHENAIIAYLLIFKTVPIRYRFQTRWKIQVSTHAATIQLLRLRVLQYNLFTSWFRVSKITERFPRHFLSYCSHVFCPHSACSNCSQLLLITRLSDCISCLADSVNMASTYCKTERRKRNLAYHAG